MYDLLASDWFLVCGSIPSSKYGCPHSLRSSITTLLSEIWPKIKHFNQEQNLVLVNLLKCLVTWLPIGICVVLKYHSWKNLPWVQNSILQINQNLVPKPTEHFFLPEDHHCVTRSDSYVSEWLCSTPFGVHSTPPVKLAPSWVATLSSHLSWHLRKQRVTRVSLLWEPASTLPTSLEYIIIYLWSDCSNTWNKARNSLHLSIKLGTIKQRIDFHGLLTTEQVRGQHLV